MRSLKGKLFATTEREIGDRESGKEHGFVRKSKVTKQTHVAHENDATLLLQVEYYYCTEHGGNFPFGNKSHLSWGKSR